MKRLVVSIKEPSVILDEFKKSMLKAKAGKLKPHFEISFDDRKNFNRFIENIHILSNIRTLKPRSIYALAKRADMDLSNLNKIILFFEKMGVIRIQEDVVSGRRVRRPIVDYDRIEFKLAG
jgi:predicted transcriptional regulator